MEDIRIMRKTTANEVHFTSDVTRAIALEQNEKRVALVIGSHGNDVVLVTINNDAATGKGMRIPQNGDALILDLQHHGRLVCGQIWVQSPTLAGQIVIWESILEDS